MEYLSIISVLVVLFHFGEAKHISGEYNNLWETYKSQYNKIYGSNEDIYRRQIWETNVHYIEHHNMEYDLGQHTYTLGLNEYADLSPEEYGKYLLGFRAPPPNKEFLGDKLFKYQPSNDLPEQVDWRKYGYVTPVKNQGQCGSCWAFSSTGSLEGQHFRQTGRLVSLSEQNLVDCCHKYGNAGCNGGWMMNSFKYVRDNQGIDTELSYPYEARNDSCRYRPGDRGAEDSGYVMIPEGDEQALKMAVAKVGPIAVAIDASHQSFQLYRSGVYNEPECSNKSSDHAVLVVGYGVNPNQDNARMAAWRGVPLSEPSQDYWLVKNSWGTSWGMEGYIMMSRNKNNQCAIATYACYPTV